MLEEVAERALERGFLPAEDPVVELPAGPPWQFITTHAPALALTDHLRARVAELPPFPLENLHTIAESRRAYVALAFLAALYVHAPRQPPVDRLPRALAVPLHETAARLGLPPILTYAAQSLYNWRRVDPHGPIEPENLLLLNGFQGGQDETWFITIHTTIEAAAAPALQALRTGQRAVVKGDAATLRDALTRMGHTLEVMMRLLRRMDERCDPYVYYHRVRPYMFGWQDEGLLYEGVAEEPLRVRGETGAQSSIIPAIDAGLGVTHPEDEMRQYLEEMHRYMPAGDRAFIAGLAAGPTVRDFVRERTRGEPGLRHAYNGALRRLAAFRRLHIEYAARFILQPAGGHAGKGTGGTPFTVYLKRHIETTEKHLL